MTYLFFWHLFCPVLSNLHADIALADMKSKTKLAAPRPVCSCGGGSIWWFVADMVLTITVSKFHIHEQSTWLCFHPPLLVTCSMVMLFLYTELPHAFRFLCSIEIQQRSLHFAFQNYISSTLTRNWDAEIVMFSIVNFQHAFLLLWCHWDTYRVPFPPTFNTSSGRISTYPCEILLFDSNLFLALSVYCVFHLTSICSLNVHSSIDNLICTLDLLLCLLVCLFSGTVTGFLRATYPNFVPQ